MIFLIPARAGSKRLPGKNVRLFCGLPLWQWSVSTAERVGGIESSIFVISDLSLIVGTTYHMHRPRRLCGDDVPTQAVVDYVFSEYPEESAICLLQPTSPTRTDTLVRKMIARGDACRSVTDGKPNGQCYVYRRGMEMVDVETEHGHDIDDLEQFLAAERDMMWRFA